jgi:hypothetical protein
LAEHIARSGPYAYHLLRRADLPRVLSEGLRPWDEREDATHNQADMMAPRPGHVYVGLYPQELEEWGRHSIIVDVPGHPQTQIPGCHESRA